MVAAAVVMCIIGIKKQQIPEINQEDTEAEQVATRERNPGNQQIQSNRQGDLDEEPLISKDDELKPLKKNDLKTVVDPTDASNDQHEFFYNP